MKAFYSPNQYGEFDEIRISDFHIGEVDGSVRFFINTEKGCIAVLLDDVKEQTDNMRQYQEASEKVLIHQVSKLAKLLGEASRKEDIQTKDSVTFADN